MIKAIKNGSEKSFTETAWKLLGKNRNGWEPIVDSVSNNVESKRPMPEIGQKAKPTTQVVENIAPKEVVEDPKVENEVKETVEVEVKEVFIAAVKDLSVTKSQIKDYLDSKEVSYKTSDSLETLAGILFAQLGDVATLKVEFSL